MNGTDEAVLPTRPHRWTKAVLASGASRSCSKLSGLVTGIIGSGAMDTYYLHCHGRTESHSLL